MRELTKSMFRLSWAMSAFGLEQMRQMVKTSDDSEANREQRVSGSCDEVSAAMDARLSDRMRSLYEAGDRLQSELVDAFFDFVSLDDWSPRAVLDRAADAAERSADALRRAATKDKEEEGACEDEPEPAG